MASAPSTPCRPKDRERFMPPPPMLPAATSSREDAMDAVLEAPFLPDSAKMRVDIITAILALLLGHPSALQ